MAKSDYSDIYLSIGDKLLKLRKRAGYTSLSKLSFDIRIDRNQLSKYEAGQDMKLSTLLKILEFYEVDINDFFGDTFWELDAKQSK